MSAPKLDVLHCTSCGAPLPLTDAAITQCAACGASVEVPEALRDVRAAKTIDEGARRKAERLARSLARPPSYVVKVLARILDQSAMAFLIVYGVPVMLGCIFGAIVIGRKIAIAIGRHSEEDLPFWVLVVLIGALLFLTTVSARALGVYAHRRASGRGRLVGAMRAKPPETAGGSACCRLCGAPLDVAKGELLAHCRFCGADNLVDVSPRWASSVLSGARNASKSIDDIEALDARERTEHLRALGGTLLSYFWRFALITGLMAIYGWDQERARPDGQFPVLGMIAMIAAVLLFIGLLIVSLATRSDDDEEAERRAGNDVPAWVGWVGPIALLALIRLAFSIR
ncbi:MAG: hypothetical protein ACHREM_19705 [Polyangiales bacterium]